MSHSSEIPGGTENAVDSIQPLEPGRPDVIPSPPPSSDSEAGPQEEVPLSPQEEAEREQLRKVEWNNSMAREHPGEI